MVQYLMAVIDMLRAEKEEGQGLVEYGLIIALVSVVAIGALTALGGGISGVLGTATGSL
jgi:pilus assembly protein Flp/PilA